MRNVLATPHFEIQTETPEEYYASFLSKKS